METPRDEEPPTPRGERASSLSDNAGLSSEAMIGDANDPRTGIDMRLPRSAPGLGRFANGCCMMRASFALYSMVPGMTKERLEDVALHLSGEAPCLVRRYAYHRETIDLMDPGEPLPESEMEWDDDDDGDDDDDEVVSRNGCRNGDGNGNGSSFFENKKIFGETTAPFAAGARRTERVLSASMIDPPDEGLIDSAFTGRPGAYRSPSGSMRYRRSLRSRRGTRGRPANFDGVSDSPTASFGGGNGRRSSKMVGFFLKRQGDDEAGGGAPADGDQSKQSSEPVTAGGTSGKSSKSDRNGNSTSGLSRDSSVESHGDPGELPHQHYPSRMDRRKSSIAKRRRQSTAVFPVAGSRKAAVELVRVPRPPEDEKFWRPPPLVRPGTLTPLLAATGSLRIVLVTHMASDKDPRPSQFGGPDNLAIVPWAFLVLFRDDVDDDDDDGRGGAANATATRPPGRPRSYTPGDTAPVLETMAEVAETAGAAARRAPGRPRSYTPADHAPVAAMMAEMHGTAEVATEAGGDRAEQQDQQEQQKQKHQKQVKQVEQVEQQEQQWQPKQSGQPEQQKQIEQLEPQEQEKRVVKAKQGEQHEQSKQQKQLEQVEQPEQQKHAEQAEPEQAKQAEPRNQTEQTEQVEKLTQVEQAEQAEEAEQQEQELPQQTPQRPRGPHSLMVVYGDVTGLAQGTDRTVPVDGFFFHPRFTQIMLSAVLLGHRSLMEAKLYYDVDGDDYDEELCYDLENW